MATLTLQQINEQAEKIKAEAQAKLDELTNQANEIKHKSLEHIRDMVEKIAVEVGVEPIDILMDVAKLLGVPDDFLNPPAPPPQVFESSGKKGRANQKKPLQDKLTAAGISYGSNYNLAQLQELVNKHNL